MIFVPTLAVPYEVADGMLWLNVLLDQPDTPLLFQHVGVPARSHSLGFDMRRPRRGALPIVHQEKPRGIVPRLRNVTMSVSTSKRHAVVGKMIVVRQIADHLSEAF